MKIAPDTEVIKMQLQEVVQTGGSGSDEIWLPSVSEEGVISWTKSASSTAPTERNIKGADGQNGTDGTDGVGIASIEKTSTSGLVDTYTITLTNGNKATFNVTNGQNGQNGTDGLGIKSVAVNGSNHLIVTYDDDTSEDAGEIDVSVPIDDTTPASNKVYSSQKVEEELSDLRMTLVETDGLLIANAVELTGLITENKYVNISDGKTKTNSNDARLVTLQVEEGEVYQLYSGFQYSVCMYSILDVNGNAIEWFPKTSQNAYTYATKTVRIPKGGAILYVGSYLTNGRVPPVIYKNTLSTAQFEVDHSSNILYGKKWCVCGDSFTAGEFSGYTDKDGHTGTSSDAYDPISKEAKTYHYLIKKRNGMRIQSLAATGATFTNISGFTKPFSNSTSTKNYTQIATDCDYITLMYGLNESDLTDEQIGTNSDNTNETLWGAYNIVLTSIFTANPKAKIGIIISDAWLSQKYHDALVAISEYWGIPYLDLRNGQNVPMMINGRLDSHSATAQALHDAIYAINYPSNMHPTPLGHEVRSTVIENFLRTL